MYYRRKILLSLLNAIGGKCDNIDFQKLLFLFCTTQETPSFNFVPYKFGCFSFQSYADRRVLCAKGILKDSKDWELSDYSEEYENLNQKDSYLLQSFLKEFSDTRGKDLIHYVYKTFPYFATRSNIAERILNKSDLAELEKHTPKGKNKKLFTIGYEGKCIDSYLNSLIKNNIKVLCDVRKNPLSRKYGFSKNQLSSALESVNIQYVHFPSLGIPSEERRELNSEADYIKLFKKYSKSILPKQTDYLVQIEDLLDNNKRIALTCFEEKHTSCHRGCITGYFKNKEDFNSPIEHL